MIALLLALAGPGLAAVPSPGASPAPTPVPVLAPSAVIAKYAAAVAQVRDPRVFTVEYTLVQSGPRTLEQTHRIFRSGGDERDETLAVNGTRSSTPVVRIFRGRPYRYTVAALSPKPSAYEFTYAGPHRDGKHVDYVFDLTPKAVTAPALAFTQVTIDGVTFLPQTVSFTASRQRGAGSVTFAKSEAFWVARSATAQADVRGGVAHEQLRFSRWRFPKTLPRSTFDKPRPLLTPPPAVIP
ncbi:MAG TPA: hypothetical protein VGX96_07330 [Candidatus Elarobacter sp.]|nr:hypothetical protein [Candidatus Elarobacter sp.]